MDKKEEIEVLEGEIMDDGPDLTATETYEVKKWPRGTRKKDYPSFTPETRETILQVTGLGAPPKYAAKYAGVSPNTLFRWLERGRIAQDRIEEGYENELAPVEKDFANFFVQYNRTQATTIVAVLGNLQRLSRNNPQALKFLLEKLDPEEFGARQAIDMNVKGRVGVAHAHFNGKELLEGGEIAKQLTTEELRELRKSLQERKDAKRLTAGNIEDGEE